MAWVLTDARIRRVGGTLMAVTGVVYGATEVVVDLTVEQEPLSRMFASPVNQVGELVQMFALMGLLAALVGRYVGVGGRDLARTMAFGTAFVGTALIIGALWSSPFVLAGVAQTSPDVVDRFRTDPSVWSTVGVLGSNAVFALGWIAVAAVEWRRRAGSRLGWAAVAVGLLVAPAVPAVGGGLLAVGLLLVGVTTARSARSDTR